MRKAAFSWRRLRAFLAITLALSLAPALSGPAALAQTAAVGQVRPLTVSVGPLSAQLEKIYVEEAPSVPLFASPLWGVFNTSRFVGFPGRARAYAGASPGQADALPALVEIAPR